MELSIVISTWNNADRLAKTLANIASCSVPQGLTWELILVNNNCTDHTDAVADHFSEQLPINLVHEPVQGLSRARNRGIEAATGQQVIFTDDDVRPCNEWIKTYWAAFKEKGTDFFFGGPVVSDYEGSPPPERYLPYTPFSVRGVNWGDEARQVRLDEPMFISANWACSHNTLSAVGGFDENLGLNAAPGQILVGEELDLMYRLLDRDLQPWYLPDAMIRHFVPSQKATPKHIVRRWRASAYVWGRYGPDHNMSRVPDWMYKVLVKDFLSWLRHIHRPEALDEYMKMLTMFERIRGLRERIRENDNG